MVTPRCYCTELTLPCLDRRRLVRLRKRSPSGAVLRRKGVSANTADPLVPTPPVMLLSKEVRIDAAKLC